MGCVPAGCVPVGVVFQGRRVPRGLRSRVVAFLNDCVPGGCVPGGCVPGGCVPGGCVPRKGAGVPGVVAFQGVVFPGVCVSIGSAGKALRSSRASSFFVQGNPCNPRSPRIMKNGGKQKQVARKCENQ